MLAEAKLGAGGADSRVRRSQVVFFGRESRYQWLYERVWAVAQECNRRFFCVDIAGVEANIQLARYDSSDQGFYDWHTDFAGYRPLRKLSVSIQLSRPDDYEGGDLELQHLPRPDEARQEPRQLHHIPELHVASGCARHARYALEPRRLDLGQSLALTALDQRGLRSSRVRTYRDSLACVPVYVNSSRAPACSRVAVISPDALTVRPCASVTT